MVIQSFLPVLGGAQRQVALLAPLLRSRGVELTAITRHPPGTPRREQRPGLTVRRMPGPDHGAAGSIAYTAGGALTLARLRPDVVHVHDLLSPSTIALLNRPLLRAPVIAKVLSTGPGGDLDRLLTKPLGRARLRAMARSFSAFLCLSESVATELAAQGIDNERLRRIPNGVDAERFRPAASTEERDAARAQLGLPAGTLALFCGRFDPVKRLDLLIEVTARAPELQVALVGEGDEEERLRAVVEARGLSDRVALLPTVDEPAPLYRAADIYVSASSTEGMSNSVLEAMASGLPVVATAASGMEELVTPASGVLIGGGDAAPERLAAALTGLARDPSRRRRLGAAGRAAVAERYSLESVADRLRALYDDVRARPVGRNGQ